MDDRTPLGREVRLSARLVEVAQALHDAPKQSEAADLGISRATLQRERARLVEALDVDVLHRRSRCWWRRSWCTRARRGGRRGRGPPIEIGGWNWKCVETHSNARFSGFLILVLVRFNAE